MSERINRISNECFRSTGFSYTLSLINGKYKMTILYVLAEFGIVRFNEMKKYIEAISYKTLSATLKELEADKLIHRKEYPQIPPKVEYSLTERVCFLGTIKPFIHPYEYFLLFSVQK